jgi:hypothetical protein
VTRQKSAIMHERSGIPTYTFVHFSVETHSWLSKSSECLLKNMAERVTSNGDCDRDYFLHWMRKEISLSLFSHNACVFQRYLGQLIIGTGTEFQPGADVPTRGDQGSFTVAVCRSLCGH